MFLQLSMSMILSNMLVFAGSQQPHTGAGQQESHGAAQLGAQVSQQEATGAAQLGAHGAAQTGAHGAAQHGSHGAAQLGAQVSQEADAGAAQLGAQQSQLSLPCEKKPTVYTVNWPALALPAISRARAKAEMNFIERPFRDVESGETDWETHHSCRSFEELLLCFSAEAASGSGSRSLPAEIVFGIPSAVTIGPSDGSIFTAVRDQNASLVPFPPGRGIRTSARSHPTWSSISLSR